MGVLRGFQPTMCVRLEVSGISSSHWAQGSGSQSKAVTKYKVVLTGPRGRVCRTAD